MLLPLMDAGGAGAGGGSDTSPYAKWQSVIVTSREVGLTTTMLLIGVILGRFAWLHALLK